MSVHAKGPWAIDDTPQGLYVLDGSGNTAVAKVMSARPDGLENALLIAASPELLAALRPFANYACETPCDCHNCRAFAVIAKATGVAA